MADDDCAECDIEERTKLYRKHLDKGEVLRNAARDLSGFSIREDGIIEYGEKKVNPNAFRYRVFAEMKELYGMDPQHFAREVLRLAAKGS